MGGLFGGGGGGEARLAGVQVQTSLLGERIVAGWGRTRTSCNLIDYVAFKSTQHSQGGKGAGGYTTYTYTASIIMALCEGPITGVRTVYKDSSVLTNGATTALAQAGLSLATGTLTQAPWGYMTSLYPSHALGYSTIAYVYAQDYALGSGAALSNHGFEVDFATQFGPNGDAVPADIATDFLTNASYGVTGWSGGLIGDWSDWALYTKAANLLLSPLLDSASAGSDFLKRLAEASNSEFFWSEGVLKAKTYGDTAVTGNSVTWTPNLTPLYDLTEDDFLQEVQLEIVDQSDAKNSVTVEYLDRSNQYQPAPMPAQDLDDIITFGLRKADVTTMHDICDAAIAQQVAQLMLQRGLYIRDRYVFRLPEDFVLLEPMDYVTLTTTVDGLKLNRQLVLIEEINEDESGEFEFVATAVPGQTASAAAYAATSSAGYQPNVDVAPGSVTSPKIFVPPAGLLKLDGEVWIGAASTSANWGGCQVWVSADGSSYQMVGTISMAARYGVLSASLASHADPDTVSTLSVDLSSSLGTLLSATATEMNAGATLSLIDNELVAYQTATLTSAFHFNLAPLRRGLFGTTPAAHSSSAPFVRLDDAIFRLNYTSLNVGSTLYVKLPSFNLYGRALEDISTVTAYTVALTALPTISGAVISSPSGTVTSAYTVTASDYLVLADATSGAVTVTLPAAASNSGRNLLIKKTDASANAVTIDPNGAELIDGAATFAITIPNETIAIVCNGTGWYIV